MEFHTPQSLRAIHGLDVRATSRGAFRAWLARLARDARGALGHGTTGTAPITVTRDGPGGRALTLTDVYRLRYGVWPRDRQRGG